MGSSCRIRALPALLLVPLATSARESAASGPWVTGGERLSDELSSTSWAHRETVGAIRALPAATSRRIARVHMLTEDGFPEGYLAMRRWTNAAGHTWLNVRIPMRPNGRTGWVRESALGPCTTSGLA